MIVTDTIAGIAVALDNISDDDTIITAEAVRQTDPGKDYVIIRLTSATIENYVGDYHRTRLHFDVGWLPAIPGSGNNVIKYEVAHTMLEALRTIKLPDGRTKKAFDTSWSVDEDAAHVLVAYDVFLDEDDTSDLVDVLQLSITAEDENGY